MLYSIYQSDDKDEQAKTLYMAQVYGEDTLYTSLDIKGDQDLTNFLVKLKELNLDQNLNFVAEMTPSILKRMDIAADKYDTLKQYGIAGVKLKGAFTSEDISSFSEKGFKVAVNAGAIEDDALAEISGLDIIAWYNSYPSPFTGLTKDFFIRRNHMFREKGIPVYAFIPGERNPESLQQTCMPTLEHQRYANVYLNYLDLKYTDDSVRIAVAEGSPHEQHAKWIKSIEDDAVLTVPLCAGSSILKKLCEITSVCIEENAAAWRIDDAADMVFEAVNGRTMHKGSMQLDLMGSGLYLMKQEMPLQQNFVCVGEIPAVYAGITDFMGSFRRVNFVKYEV